MIKHIWLDFSDTIARIDREKHNELKYAEYARLKGVNLSETVIEEYKRKLVEHGNNNSNVFVQEFGVPSSFWPDFVSNYLHMYSLMEPSIPEMIQKISERIPLSVFSNIDTRKVMTDLGIDISHFTHILSAATLEFPKPHESGYKKVIEMSGLSAAEILYIGDDEKKDILPAKAVGLQTGFLWGTCPDADYAFKSFENILIFAYTQNQK